MKARIERWLLGLKMAVVRRLLRQPLVALTHDPRSAQHELLRHILHRNRETRFGREHGFRHIKTAEQYRQAVPVRDYEGLRADIEAQSKYRVKSLSSEYPVLYTRTSGTTSQPKFIPVTAAAVKRYRRDQQLFAEAVHAAVPGAFDGKILAITSPATEGFTAAGVPWGSLSGMLYESMSPLVRRKYVLPSRVFRIADHGQRYREIARRALCEREISLMATANPSTLLQLEEAINAGIEGLIADVAKVDGDRARQIDALVARNGTVRCRHLWPTLKAVATWTGGNCGVLVPEVRAGLPRDARIVELGYLASEFRGTITLDASHNRQVPTLHDNYFEFIEQADREQGRERYVELADLVPGRRYYIIVTTGSGLYRYDINDLVEVTGQFNRTPTLGFVQKGEGVVSLTGEKLYEGQLVEAVSGLLEEQGEGARFFKMMGCPRDRRYTLFVEGADIDQRRLDAALAHVNIEFADKRRSGRLRATRVIRLPSGAGKAYKQYCLGQGQCEAQFKTVSLEQVDRCGFDFNQWISEAGDEAA